MQRSDELFAELAGGHEEPARRFSLDPKQAKEKLAGLELPDAAACWLLFLRGAIRRGATRIELRVGPRWITLTADGEPLSAGELERRFDAVFDAEVDAELPGLRELTLGLAAASAGARAEASLRTGGAQPAALRVAPRGADRLLAGPQAGKKTPALEIRARRAPFPREDPRRRWLADGAGERRSLEELSLLQLARYAPVEIRASGRRLSEGFASFESDPDPVTIAAAGITGRARFRPEASEEPGRLLLVKDGVVVRSEEVAGWRSGFLAVVDAPALTLDFTGLSAVTDEACKGARHAAQAAYQRAVDSGVSARARKRSEADRALLREAQARGEAAHRRWFFLRRVGLYLLLPIGAMFGFATLGLAFAMSTDAPSEDNPTWFPVIIGLLGAFVLWLGLRAPLRFAEWRARRAIEVALAGHPAALAALSSEACHAGWAVPESDLQTLRWIRIATRLAKAQGAPLPTPLPAPF